MRYLFVFSSEIQIANAETGVKSLKVEIVKFQILKVELYQISPEMLFKDGTFELKTKKPGYFFRKLKTKKPGYFFRKFDTIVFFDVILFCIM